jgi:hypothetical protein
MVVARQEVHTVLLYAVGRRKEIIVDIISKIRALNGGCGTGDLMSKPLSASVATTPRDPDLLSVDARKPVEMARAI